MTWRTCQFCWSSVEGDTPCPNCEKKHKAGHGTSAWTQRRVGARNLDQIEGNAEEWFGGGQFAINPNHRRRA